MTQTEQQNVPELRFPEFEEQWKKTTLGSESECLDNLRIPLKEGDRSQRRGKFPYYGASGVIDYIDEYLFNEDLVLLSEDGANIIMRSTPVAFIASGQYWVNNHAHVYRAIGSTKFLAEALERINYTIYNTGTAQPKLNGEVCKKLPLIFPTLPEQRKIAGFLGAVDARIAQVTRKKALLTDYKKGCMQQLFSQSIRFKDDQGNNFPDWEAVGAGDLFRSVSNKDHNGDLPLLAITQENGATLRDGLDKDIKVSAEGIKNYKIVEPDDFIISLRSFQGGIEHSSVLGICSPAYTILKPLRDIIPYYFKQLFKREQFISQLSATTIGIREGKQISFGAFSTLRLPLPHLDEQRKIADFLSAIDTKVDLLAQELEQAKAFKKGLLQQMFV